MAVCIKLVSHHAVIGRTAEQIGVCVASSVYSESFGSPVAIACIKKI